MNNPGKSPNPNHGNIVPQSEDELKPAEKYGDSFAEKVVYENAYHAARRLWEVEELRHQNDHDNLTGLLNRDAWMNMAEEAARRKMPFGIVFTDLANFKAVNDKYGHDKGDQVLKEFATLLRDIFRSRPEDPHHDLLAHERLIKQHNGTPGRFGGDEFKILVDLTPRPDSDSEISMEARMDVTVNRMQADISKFIDERPDIKALGFDADIGYAIWHPDMNVPVEETLHEADLAMYAAKRARSSGNR